MDGQLTGKMASGGGWGGPGAAARGDKADRAGGHRARAAGGTRRRFSRRPRPAVPAAPRASFHTSPPPAPSVRSREYPLPPRSHLLLPGRPLASLCPPHPGARRTRCGARGPSSARMPRAGRGGMGSQEPRRAREGRGPADGAPKAGAGGARPAGAPGQCGHRGAGRGLRSDGGQFLAGKPDAAGGGEGARRLGGRAGEPFCGPGRERAAAGGVAGC